MELKQGVLLSTLEKGTHLTVSTKNSTYQLITEGGILVKIQGGSRSNGNIRYTSYQPALIHGSIIIGDAIKIGWIGIGYQLIFIEAETGFSIQTSCVQSLDLISDTLLLNDQVLKYECF